MLIGGTVCMRAGQRETGARGTSAETPRDLFV
jgi:hypothetical protein